MRILPRLDHTDKLGAFANSGYRKHLLRIVCGTKAGGCDAGVRMSEFTKAFGVRVREVRVKRGFSQEELADAAGLHRTHISLIERDRRSIRLETLASLAKALTVEPSELIPPLKQGSKKK